MCTTTEITKELQTQSSLLDRIDTPKKLISKNSTEEKKLAFIPMQADFPELRHKTKIPKDKPVTFKMS